MSTLRIPVPLLTSLVVLGLLLPSGCSSGSGGQHGLSAEQIASALPQADGDTVYRRVALEKRPTVVMFSAEWCPPCKLVKPDLAQLARAHGERVTTMLVDVDADPALAQAVGVQSLPTVVAYRDGKAVDHVMGAVPASELAALYVRLTAADTPRE